VYGDEVYSIIQVHEPRGKRYSVSISGLF